MPALDVASYLIDIIGTLAFAVAGAMVGADRHMDLFGVLSMGASRFPARWAEGGPTPRYFL